MNRDKVIKLISESQHKNLLDELDYFMEIEREDKYDQADALNDAYDFALENNERTLIKEIRLILIEADYYVKRPVKPTSCRDFRITVNKTKYDCVSGWEEWINE